ncbi:flagellar motor switch phosphatase FliY [Proteocatella sphenisci]|uniref:flagellar motor switch phosphatase FliY n=1 Tax=Proteocatella sphenisci TaxID=181070 RepID=UPI000490E725|nr:flagellar motor switch phosphatase FliY [Proteocatella sphenisci]
MSHDKLNPIEIDAIGEIINISLGASATAVATMLDRRVDITTPNVKVVTFDEFEFKRLEPAIGVEITYTHGLSGNNVMIIKKMDVKTIVEILMGSEIPDEEFEMNELYVSAICEVMNQMMGASATAMSEFIGETVNITTPTSFEIENSQQFKEKYFEPDANFVSIEFSLSIENSIKCEFVNLMPIPLVKMLVSRMIPDQSMLEDPAPVAPPQAAMPQTPAAQPQEAPVQQEAPPTPPPQPQVPQYEQPAAAQRQEQPTAAPQPNRTIDVKPIPAESFASKDPSKELAKDNLELLMDVPLEISVEIGRTRKLVKEIVEFTQGSLIVLDKLAGDQVEIYANERCIARGDVVVVNDNFGVRITEIVK